MAVKNLPPAGAAPGQLACREKLHAHGQIRRQRWLRGGNAARNTACFEARQRTGTPAREVCSAGKEPGSCLPSRSQEGTMTHVVPRQGAASNRNGEDPIQPIGTRVSQQPQL